MAKNPNPQKSRPLLITLERSKVLEQWWPTDKPIPEIIDMLNKLPGSGVNNKNIREYARKLELRRPDYGVTFIPQAPTNIDPDTISGLEDILIEDALNWAKRNSISTSGDVAAITVKINQVRAVWGLPGYNIIIPAEPVRFQRRPKSALRWPTQPASARQQ